MRNIKRILTIAIGATALCLTSTAAFGGELSELASPPPGTVFTCPQQTSPGVAHCGAIKVIHPHSADQTTGDQVTDQH